MYMRTAIKQKISNWLFGIGFIWMIICSVGVFVCGQYILSTGKEIYSDYATFFLFGLPITVIPCLIAECLDQEKK